MVRSTLSLSLLATAASLQGALGFGTPVPNRFVVEFQNEEDAVALKATMARDDVNVKMDFNYTLFKGASIELTNPETSEKLLAEIQAMAGINTYQVKRIPRPNAEVKWSGNPDAMYPDDKLSPRGTNSTGRTNNATTAYGGLNIDSTHAMTQVDKVRAAGYRGKGVKIGVIDTGIDYLHPALGGCFGPGCLVTHGHDFVGDAYNGDGLTLPVPDNDPMDCGGHGTHVSGIIAAQTNPFGFTGAAPDVTLGAYKVFGCEGSVENDILIAAFNQAYEDGSDIITASIGGPSGWSEDPWAVAVERIIAKGVPCTLAAGNDGADGMWYASTASSGKKVFSVASIDNVNTPSLAIQSTYSVDGDAPVTFQWTDGTPYKAWGEATNMELWPVGLNVSDPANGCDASAYADAPDLSDKVVLIRRGTCLFTLKAQLAADHGAKFVLIYNNVAGTFAVDVSAVPEIEGVGMVSATLGEKLVNMIADGHKIKVNMINPDESIPVLSLAVNGETGGSMSDYTSWGPTWEMDVRPVFAAPGGNIISTYPRAKGSYAVLSGTSMATPLVAAITALIGEIRGSFEPSAVENLLANFGTPIEFNFGSGAIGYLAPVPQQGAGQVRAFDAAFATSTLSRPYISFNDTDNFVKSTEFEITNTGKKTLTYSIGHSPALTAYTKANASAVALEAFPNDLDNVYATLTFSETSVTLAPGSKKTITVSAQPPTGLDVSLLPVWSGYITVGGSDNSSMVLPYQGLTGSLKNLVQMDKSATYLTSIPADEASPWTTYDHTPVGGNASWVLPAPGTNNASALTAAGVVLPGIQIDLVAGSALIRADLVPLTSCPPNATHEVLGYKVLGQHYDFPMTYSPRQSIITSWNGLLNDGSYAPAGKYMWVFRSLKIFGDASKAEDYMTIQSEPFHITYASNSTSTVTRRRRTAPFSRRG
ncbi:hypothetical protein TD95_000784 [Thielaviopsis punctulata]|uniref:Peptidase S8/S53 domain-containing protein n=1 Tax=Thielaviopsis punctulata TaxID=72032 RepID=A0A0F4Z8I6_9PEZI|nr:hypothetical protein TD95_000784 [Thielaviopsis punctulata]